MTHILFGHNPEQGVVALHQQSDQEIRLYQRQNGKVRFKDVEFFPFFLLTTPTLLEGFQKQHWLKELAGTHPYRYIAVFSRWNDMWEAIHHILKVHNKTNTFSQVASYTELTSLFLRDDPVRQFLLQSGITLFKGMKYKDIVQMFIDITIAPPHTRRKAQRFSQRIWIISARTNTGSAFQQSSLHSDDASLLTEFARFVQSVDPDILIGHHLSDHLLPFLLQRANELAVELPLGRDFSPPRLGGNRLPFSSSEILTHSIEIVGRHIIDIHSLAEAHEQQRQEFQKATLSAIANYYGISPSVAENTSAECVEIWGKKPQQLLHNSTERVKLLAQLTDQLLPAFVQLATMCPFNLSLLLKLSATSLAESLLLREYIRRRHSVPQPQNFTRTYVSNSEFYYGGVFKNVLSVKLLMLYYAAIKNEKINPASDILNVFDDIRKELEQQYFASSAPQHSFSYLLNALPLMVSSQKALFNDPLTAENIHTTIHKILQEVLAVLERHNVITLQRFQDTIFLALPDNIQGVHEEENFLARINALLPYPLALRKIQSYPAFLSHRRRSYALLGNDGTIHIAGSFLLPRAAERYLRMFAYDCLNFILTEQFEKLHERYVALVTQILQHTWQPKDFCRIEIAKINSSDYLRERRISPHVLSPAFEAAERAKRYIQKGDTIAYYITGTHADVKLADFSALAEVWNPHTPNENTQYYLARLREYISKLKDFFDPLAFESIFNPDSLFGLQLPQHPLKTFKLEEEEQASAPSASDEFGIWLAEDENHGEKK